MIICRTDLGSRHSNTLMKEEYENMVVETIRIRVFLCFYCDFEDSDKGDMRNHFEMAHDLTLSKGGMYRQN